MTRYRSILLEFAKDMKGTARLGKKHNLPVLSSSLAFFSIFSLCPLLIISFLAGQYFLRQIGTDMTHSEELNRLLNILLPSADPTVSQNVLAILERNAATNFFNLGLLCWSVYQLFDALNTAFINLSVRGNVRSPVWTNVICAFCFLVVLGASTFFLILHTIDPEILRKLLSQYLGDSAAWQIKAAALWLSVGLVLLSITFIFKLMPTQKIKLLHAFRGSVLFILFFLCGREAYQLYSSYYRFMNEDTFGPFFTFIMVIVWIYYLSRSFLFSAQYSIYLAEKSLPKTGGSGQD